MAGSSKGKCCKCGRKLARGDTLICLSCSLDGTIDDVEHEAREQMNRFEKTILPDLINYEAQRRRIVHMMSGGGEGDVGVSDVKLTRTERLVSGHYRCFFECFIGFAVAVVYEEEERDSKESSDTEVYEPAYPPRPRRSVGWIEIDRFLNVHGIELEAAYLGEDKPKPSEERRRFTIEFNRSPEGFHAECFELGIWQGAQSQQEAVEGLTDQIKKSFKNAEFAVQEIDAPRKRVVITITQSPYRRNFLASCPELDMREEADDPQKAVERLKGRIVQLYQNAELVVEEGFVPGVGVHIQGLDADPNIIVPMLAYRELWRLWAADILGDWDEEPEGIDVWLRGVRQVSENRYNVSFTCDVRGVRIGQEKERKLLQRVDGWIEFGRSLRVYGMNIEGIDISYLREEKSWPR